MKETDLAKHFVDYFSCYDLYFEVDYGRCVDIVALAEKFTIAIEVKTSFNFKVLEQAVDNKKRFNYSYIAVPHFKDSRFQEKLCEDYGIGLLFYENEYLGVRSIVNPKLNRKIQIRNIYKHLHEYSKNSLPGSKNGDGTKITAFDITVDNLFKYVKRNPGKSIREAISNISHHYTTEKVACSCIYQWINKGVITCIKFDNNKLYPNE